MNEKKLYQDEISLSLPEGFIESEKENDSDHPFDYVFRNPDRTKCIAFVRNEQNTAEEDVRKMLQNTNAVLSEITPGFQFGEAKIKETEQFDIGLLTYRSKVADKDLFNVFAVMNLNEKELIMTFLCEMQDSNSFLPQVIETIDSINVGN